MERRAYCRSMVAMRGGAKSVRRRSQNSHGRWRSRRREPVARGCERAGSERLARSRHDDFDRWQACGRARRGHAQHDLAQRAVGRVDRPTTGAGPRLHMRDQLTGAGPLEECVGVRRRTGNRQLQQRPKKYPAATMPAPCHWSKIRPSAAGGNRDSLAALSQSGCATDLSRSVSRDLGALRRAAARHLSSQRACGES